MGLIEVGRSDWKRYSVNEDTGEIDWVDKWRGGGGGGGSGGGGGGGGDGSGSGSEGKNESGDFSSVSTANVYDDENSGRRFTVAKLGESVTCDNNEEAKKKEDHDIRVDPETAEKFQNGLWKKRITFNVILNLKRTNKQAVHKFVSLANVIIYQYNNGEIDLYFIYLFSITFTDRPFIYLVLPLHVPCNYRSH